MGTTYDAMPSVEAQYKQAARWAQLLRKAGYIVTEESSGEPEPFDREWIVFTNGGSRVASVDIDGCGASWHGPDELWLRVIGKSEGVTD